LILAQKSGVGAASAAREPCALRLKAHLQNLIPGLHVLICAKPFPPIIELIRLLIQFLVQQALNWCTAQSAYQ